MEEIVKRDDLSVFNTDLEAGIRAICILDKIYPKSVDLDTLIKTDYMIIYTGDFGGPESLHRNMPNKKFSLNIRYSTVKNGIELMQKFEMVELVPKRNGIYYRATGKASPYLNLMICDYSKKLISNAEWVAELIAREQIDDNLRDFNVGV